jgi:hypothetical protein
LARSIKGIAFFRVMPGCDRKPKAAGKGRITYAGGTCGGVTESTGKQDGKDMTITTTMKEKHIGPCRK